MGDWRPREERKPVGVRARLRTAEGWSDVTIANASSRGLMLHCTLPPGRSSFVEIRKQDICIVGRIIWSENERCGVRTQDAVDIAALVSSAPRSPRKAGEDRRKSAREVRRAPSIVERAEASRRFARLFDRAAIALALAGGAVLLADLAGSALAAPFERVEMALAGAGGRDG